MFVIGENGFDASLLSAVTQRIHRVSVVYWWASRLAGTRFSWLCGHGAKETAHVNGDAMIARLWCVTEGVVSAAVVMVTAAVRVLIGEWVDAETDLSLRKLSEH